MTNYNFELIFKLNADENPEDYIDALYEAGCDDANPGIGLQGEIGLEFNRDTPDAFTAIRSAIVNVRTAIPHAVLKRAGPYLQNLSELAFEFGFTKQNMQKYARGKAANTITPFPTPFIEGKTSYWAVSDIAQWLKNEDIVDVEDCTIEVMCSIRALNLAIERIHTQCGKLEESYAQILKVA